MGRRILEMPPGRDRLLEEQEAEDEDPRDGPVARKTKGLPVDVERIETAAERLHVGGVEELAVQVRGHRGQLALHGLGRAAGGLGQEKPVADHEGIVGRGDRAAGLHAAALADRDLLDSRIQRLRSRHPGKVARGLGHIPDGIQIGRAELERAHDEVADVALLGECEEHQTARGQAPGHDPTQASRPDHPPDPSVHGFPPLLSDLDGDGGRASTDALVEGKDGAIVRILGDRAKPFVGYIPTICR